jgi:hypothetical protein
VLVVVFVVRGMVGVDVATTRRRMDLSVPLFVVEEKREGGGEDGGARGGKRLGFYRGASPAVL